MTLGKKVLLALLSILLVIQFFRPKKNISSPVPDTDITKVVTVPENVKIILNTACYDCHSNNTRYPWYTEIMPLGWWLNHHIEEGKEHLNFSVFATYSAKEQDHKLEECEEEVEEKEMPLKSYTRIHKDADLTEEQIHVITSWIDAARKEITSGERNKVN